MKTVLKSIYLLLCLLFTLLLIGTVPMAYASDIPNRGEPLDTRTLAMINKPGVVLVQTTWTADITFYEFDFIDGFEEDLTYAIAALVEEGSIANTTEAMYSAMVQLMIESMGSYIFYTGNSSKEQVQSYAVGTGFIVTPDGYLVTNAHVIETDEESLYMDFAISTLSDYAVEGTNSFVEEMRREGYQMSQEEIDGMMNAFYNLLAYSIEVNNLQTTYHCYMGNIIPGSDTGTKVLGLDVCKKGEPIPGKDIAILKLDKTNLPTVTLGDDTSLRVGDKVYAMGYPAAATLDATLNIEQAIQEPTLTSGIISAKKEMAGGWSVLQTDAAIHGGNSGGPLFNEAGEVIGINTFIMRDQESGGQVAGMNFAIPINIANQFLNEINVTPQESDFTTQYKKALSLYNKKDYHSALEILRGLNETNPGYPVISDLLAETRKLADQNPQVSHDDNQIENKSENSNSVSEEAKSVSSTRIKNKKDNPISRIPLAVILIIGGIFLIVITLIIILLSSKKKKPQNTHILSKSPVPNQIPMQNQPQHIEKQDEFTFCTECGTKLPKNAKFCGHCGANQTLNSKVETVCPSCGEPIDITSQFCINCGHEMKQ